MKGVQYLVDEHGEKTGVVIDLRENAALWEDIYDSAVEVARRGEPRVSFDAVKRHLRRLGKLRGK
jgi:hypothetical protein